MTTDTAGAVNLAGLLTTLEPSRLNHLGDAVFRLLGVLVVYVLFALCQRYLRRFHLLRVIALQLNLLVLTLLVLAFLAPVLLHIHVQMLSGCVAAAVFLGIAMGLKIVDVLWFDVLARWRKRPQMPLVVRDIGRWTLSLVALVLIVRGFFPGVNLNVLAVSSIVVGYILGNATQDTLGNLVAGLALNTERPFHIGDWVTVSGNTGIVVDTTWRATRLETKAGDFVVIPNASIAREPITNFSRPTRRHGCYLNVGVDYASPPNTVREVMLGVLADAPEVLKNPLPVVYLVGYGDFSMNFTLKFFIEDYARLDVIQSAIMDRLWYAFKRHGIGIPYPIQDVRLSNRVADERRKEAALQASARGLLKAVDLFQSLSEPEVDRLVAQAKPVPYAAGEVLCRQGDPGDSFYVIRSGTVSVWVTGSDGKAIPVARLTCGAFFGEMSLLTGEPRSATVTAESDVDVLSVSKQDFAGLLRDNAGLAAQLAAAVEHRATDRHAKMTSIPAGETASSTRSTLTARIRKFFGLG